MATVVLTINRVSYLNEEDKLKVYFKETFKGIVPNGDKFEEADINFIKVNPRYFAKSFCDAHQAAAYMYQHRKDNGGSLGAAEYSLLCKGAELTVERIRYTPEDKYVTSDGEEVAYNGVKWDNSIVSMKFTEQTSTMLDNMLMQIVASLV